ncbi:DNA translocase FtsK [Candidatus Nesciobacter abundans]|uniref:Cell division protein FtsK n=1 Tax=Candidatus Nesciobacter abundans TaxID=2601668 RepID=A0A5C0UFJ9_9PROT|nr:DNA translocase FtsK [Candidatus Nesciobacter abundans]QEK38838.1 cell division protein FtsK [Candidatus Nesciobacter abundans]
MISLSLRFALSIIIAFLFSSNLNNDYWLVSLFSFFKSFFHIQFIFIPFAFRNALSIVLFFSNSVLLNNFGIGKGMFGEINSRYIPTYAAFIPYGILIVFLLYKKIKQRNLKTLSNKPKNKKPANSSNNQDIPAKKLNVHEKVSGNEKSNKFNMPSISFLSSIRNKTAETISKDVLARVLKEFKVEGRLLDKHTGPVVTVFEFEPAPGVKASRIINLAYDIARSTESLSARIAPIPGKNLLGIELANKVRNMVTLKEVLASNNFMNTSASLPLALGCDIAGRAVVVDLVQMPHLLVSGTTGSGKSVSMHSMMLSLLYSKTPDECKFILIDPKMLELSIYNDIPHLLSPVVTDPKEAIQVLKWVVQEMERRYKLLSKAEVRNVHSYNQKAKQNKETEIPFLVVVVDEFADLMLTAGKEVEISVQRLAQMARASGIHIIMATQRPSVDVVTGTMKSNFPTRITFQLASSTDSRTIMGYNSGAEQLLGKGDMLYLSPGQPTIRMQGPFVSDDEVQKIIGHLKASGKPEYIKLHVIEDLSNLDNGNSEDLTYKMALRIVLEEKKVSISYLQRRLSIGYNKSAKIVEEMEKQGIVSTPDRTGKREVLK